MARKKSSKTQYNKVLKMADYAAFGVSNRKQWEVEMALQTLRDAEVTGPDALILGAGAGIERTIFELANAQDSRFVFATDLYIQPGEWIKQAGGPEFLVNPAQFAKKVVCNSNQIIPRHADMRSLPFDEKTFDGIFSSGSIEHVGGWKDIAQAAKEIGRVLKPGGVASLSTEWKLAGDGWGWGNVRLFDEESILRYIIEPSGLELIDPLDTEFDGDINHYVVLSDIVLKGASSQGYGLLKEHDFLFTSVHLALRKPA
jgi:SAM-dependent methyltransferase